MSDNGVQNAYAVGYGKPPQQSRFRKGESGNPKGRPRKSDADKQFEDIVSKALDVGLNEVREVTTLSGPTKLTRKQIMVRNIVERAADGKMIDIKRIFKLREKIKEEPALNPVVVEMDDGDLEVCGAENIPAIRARMDAAKKERVGSEGKGGISLKALIDEELFRTKVFRIKGKPVQITMLERIVLQLSKAALQGDHEALTLLVKLQTLVKKKRPAFSMEYRPTGSSMTLRVVPGMPRHRRSCRSS